MLEARHTPPYTAIHRHTPPYTKYHLQGLPMMPKALTCNAACHTVLTAVPHKHMRCCAVLRLPAAYFLPADGRTALMLACVRGHRDVVSLLLAAGRDQGAQNQQCCCYFC
jgi:hypothetical protein